MLWSCMEFLKTLFRKSQKFHGTLNIFWKIMEFYFISWNSLYRVQKIVEIYRISLNSLYSMMKIMEIYRSSLNSSHVAWKSLKFIEFHGTPYILFLKSGKFMELRCCMVPGRCKPRQKGGTHGNPHHASFPPQTLATP